MALPLPQTPQKALPGAYVQTPAAHRFATTAISQPEFRSVSASARQQYGGQVSGTPGQPHQLQVTERPGLENIRPVERAAKSINDTLSQESRFPEIDSYVGRELYCETAAGSRLTMLQRVFRLITMYRRNRHGVPFRGRKHTLFLTKSSNSITGRKYRR